MQPSGERWLWASPGQPAPPSPPPVAGAASRPPSPPPAQPGPTHLPELSSRCCELALGTLLVVGSPSTVPTRTEAPGLHLSCEATGDECHLVAGRRHPNLR